MKPIRLILIAMLSLLSYTGFGQGDGVVASHLMRKDTGLLLIKRQQTAKYIVAAAVEKPKHILYLLDRQGNAWDSLKVSPEDCKKFASRQADPFNYYIDKQRLGITYQNELIRQFRERGKLDSLSPLYLSAIANFPQFKHTDSTTLIKAILTLERQNRRDSIYAWGGNISDPRYFQDAMTYAHSDARQPGERFTSGDTLFFINPEPLSRVHLAILIKNQSKISYYSRDGKYLTGFTLDAGEMKGDLSKTDVFGNYLDLLEEGKLMLDRQVAQLSKYKGPFVRFTGLNQENNKALTDALARQRSLDEKLDYALSPDLKALATTLKADYTNTPPNRPWLSFLGVEDYTTPPSWDSVGTRRYELTNHLGNVLATITDKRIASGSYFLPDINTAQDYYAFGALMPARSFKADSNYRYGFNGKENDNAVKGVGNQQDYGMRIYDPRVGRFLSVDPIANSYPQLTPYQHSSDDPINFIDLDGAEKARPKHASDPITQTMDDVQRIIYKKAERLEVKLATMTDDQITDLINKTVSSALKHPEKLIDNLKKQSDDAVDDGIHFLYLVASGQSKKAENLAANAIVKFGPLFLFPEEDELTAGETELFGSKSAINTEVDFETIAGQTLAKEEKTVGNAHFYSRHGAQTTLNEQYIRATKGIFPEGGVGKLVNSTRFLSNELQLKALDEAKIIYSITGDESFTFDMGDIVGEGYYKGGGDLQKTSTVRAVFRNGQPYTLYPELKKQ